MRSTSQAPASSRLRQNAFCGQGRIVTLRQQITDSTSQNLFLGIDPVTFYYGLFTALFVIFVAQFRLSAVLINSG